MSGLRRRGHRGPQPHGRRSRRVLAGVALFARAGLPTRASAKMRACGGAVSAPPPRCAAWSTAEHGAGRCHGVLRRARMSPVRRHGRSVAARPCLMFRFDGKPVNAGRSRPAGCRSRRSPSCSGEAPSSGVDGALATPDADLPGLTLGSAVARCRPSNGSGCCPRFQARPSEACSALATDTVSAAASSAASRSACHSASAVASLAAMSSMDMSASVTRSSV